jgi:hypothetical protein
MLPLDCCCLGLPANVGFIGVRAEVLSASFTSS